MQGHSLAPLLAGEKGGSRSASGVGYELHGTQAYFKDDFKILKMPIPMGTGRWELFNIANAPYEQNNLVLFEQDKLAELIAENKAYEERVGVIYTVSPVIKKITSVANALLALGAMLFSVLAYIIVRRRQVTTSILAAVQVVAVIGLYSAYFQLAAWFLIVMSVINLIVLIKIKARWSITLPVIGTLRLTVYLWIVSGQLLGQML